MTAIPDSIRIRLQKLIALANDGRGNEHEAASASAKVQALLAEYNLEMSQVVADGGDGGEIAPDASRESGELDLYGAAAWQRNLLRAIASNNFCLCYIKSHVDDTKYNLIGRRVNVETVVNMFAYLSGTASRVCPFTDRRKKSYASWYDGCTQTLITRLNMQRRESEAASRSAREENRGNGSDLILSDIYSSEDDLNRDFRHGYAPGTTARNRADSDARWEAERLAREEARRNAPAVVEPAGKPETDAQRRKRIEREEAETRRYWQRYDRRERAQAAKRDPNAYAMGQNAGSQISLNRQVS